LTIKHASYKLNCAGRNLSLARPAVMGILNITPDSFYDGGSYLNIIDQLKQVEKMISEGASIIDIGANSTRPGAEPVTEKEELARLLPSLTAINGHFSEIVISVDTYRTPIAKAAIEHGATIINDTYGGRYDGEMFELIAHHNIPYILMHMQGSPDTMQINPHYKDVVKEIHEFFKSRIDLIPSGYNQFILDPGFGFGKTVENNFLVLKHFESFCSFKRPLLAGLSRKSMINRILQIKPQKALNGTTVLNTIALMKGANILRVHDVKEAVEAINLLEAYNQ